jgi:Yip1 domain
MQAPLTRLTFGQRLKGVLTLDAPTYEEIEADRSATGQAFAVVLVSSLAAGVGAGLVAGAGGLVAATIAALLGWLLWAGLTYLVGAKLMPEPQTSATWGQLARTIGFASAPNALAFFVFIPVLGPLITFVAAVWALATTIVGVRQALDYRSTFRAAAVVFVGWLVFVMLQLLF